jgi:hypothetical protein
MWVRWAGPRLGLSPLFTIRPQRQERYILMPESLAGDNNTIGLTCYFRLLGLRKRFENLRLTPRRTAHISAAPTANGVYRKRHGVRVTGGSSTPAVRSESRRSRPPGRVFYASSVRKGIRRRRRTSALTLGSAADVFVVASSKSNLLASVQRGWTK